MNSATLFAGMFMLTIMICPPFPSAGDRQIVLDRIVGELLEEMLVGCVSSVGCDEYGVAVRRRLLDHLRADKARCARPVVDDHRLLRDSGDFLAERARELVRGASGREGHDEGELLVGILGMHATSPPC